MVIKTICALALYLLPFIACLVFKPDNLILLFALWIAMGAGMAFMGTSVMHDSIHGSYTKKKNLKKVLAKCTWILGIDATIWKTQHNVLHHSFTNIEGADEDIQPRYVLRFSPHQPRRWFHRYQHIYALFFYTISTLIWVTFKDFNKARQYRKMGILPVKSYSKFILGMVFRKIFYFSIFLILPIYLLPVSAGTVVLLFVVMHMTAGFLLSLIFQPAHVMEVSDFIDQQKEEPSIDENRLVHQLRTTTNFGMKNRWLTWFSGGLNHQIEHHLYQNICHVHYGEISKIVRHTAAEHDLPYHTQPGLGRAFYLHLSMLKALGSGKI